jgi:3-dehydroquinate synthase
VEPVQIEIQSERAPYTALVGAGALSRLGGLLAERGADRDVLVVSCPPVWRLHARRLAGVSRGKPAAMIPDGERAKTLQSVARVYDACIRRRLDRSATLVGFGGGVVGDVAGFAAATYLRGIRLVQAPTTLLAQVDSAIGGKVGVNLPTGKNLVGAFHPPSLVVCDPEVLRTLPRREFRSGLYEVIKYGVIASPSLLDRLADNLARVFAHDSAVLSPIVAECCRIKGQVVSADEREAGPRRVLNFGHTVGHALEAITRYRRFRHGEAIAYGMLAAARISAARGLLPNDAEERLKTMIQHLGPLPLVTDLRIGEALEAITHDKKIVEGQLHFVLANGLGSTAIVTDVTTADLRTAMASLGMRR